MNIRIEYQSNKPITLNSYTAELGFQRRGYTPLPFTRAELTTYTEADWPWVRNDIWVGGTPTLLYILDQLGIPRPPSYVPHLCLPDFCGRAMGICNLWEVKGRPYPYFIKPAADTKLFSGRVIRTDADLAMLTSVTNPATAVLISELIDIKAEYRCFMFRSEFVEARFYAGDWTYTPDWGKIQEAFHAFAHPPAACTLDFAVTASGETLLIEINDGYALGTCGLHPLIYSEMLEARWLEIINI